MGGGKFGSFHVKTEWNQVLRSREYHITYPAFPMIRFTISSMPKDRLSWDEIIEKVREKEEAIYVGFGGKDA